ncbi:hypothetical protein FHR83_009348 [Actinoplanes campanulatus]|uniref:Wadjet protein JetD C-terminal domain-containing protein n=1 Tax=Actinoplanes campanulatus TaxID=113559 RepID=A0A7W5ASY1_9ACTN|nr:Wadjet anti-phage system protein JetD domain-containing protein [Actinoplanes campanulatus]MBB3101617.1 hypothetical protein [Actinoplanes campanulatus]GGN51708.1 hypothetical protein GCM10010109_92070 [Actinoplanes campanulatus]GID42683.1 hypothetical protein Aca09nite_91890 [Actinoplanes campanulatus]
MATRIERLAEALYQKLTEWATARRWTGTTRKNVPIDEVRRCFHIIYQRRSSDGTATEMLRDSLSVLTARALIVPARATDAERIPLPTKIRIVPVTARSPKAMPRMPRWHPLLYSLEDAWPTATDKQRVRYQAINTWLLSNPDTTVVPLRERTLEIFSAAGDEEAFPFPEKALDDMREGPLFGDQARLLNLLHAVATPPPLLSRRVLEEVAENQWTCVGKGDLLLVVENSATWWSLVRSLPETHNVGHIAWGLGASFMASVRSIVDHNEIRRIRYFGDLDLSGLRIPSIAQRAACTADLPQVLPAAGLYTELFATGRSWQARDPAADEDQAQALAAWLPEEHRDAAAELLMQGRRMAQEWVGYRHLSNTRKWHADLL